MSGRSGFRVIIVVCLLTLVSAGGGRADAPITLTDIRIGQHKTYTRLVLETAAKVPYALEQKAGDDVVVVLASALRGSNRPVPRAAGLIKKFAFDVGDDTTRLTVLSTKPARVLRHFAIPGTKGRKPRIVIDLATKPGTRTVAAEPSRPATPIQLPPMHTSIVVEDPAPAPASPKQEARTQTRNLAPRRTASTQMRRRTQPVEIAHAGGIQMLFEGDDSDPEAPEAAAMPTDPAPVEIAQNSVSMSDWLREQHGNPNISRDAQSIDPQLAPPRPYTPGSGHAYGANSQQQHSRPIDLPIVPQSTTAAQTQAPVYYTPTVRRGDYRGPIYETYQRQLREAGKPPSPETQDAATTTASQETARIEGSSFSGWDPNFKFYVGGGGGLTFFRINSEERGSQATSDEPPAWKFFAGYRATDLISIETSFGSLGGIDETFPNGSTEDDYKVLALNGVISLPTSGRARPFVKAGLNLWRTDKSITGTVQSTDDSGYGMQVGAGADFAVTQKLALRGEWEFYYIDDNIYANSFTANLMLNF